MIRKDIHKLPIKFKTHAAIRLIDRFDMDIEEFRHFLKTGKMVKKPKKDGNIGIIQRKVGKDQIQIIFTIRKKHYGELQLKEVKKND